MWRMCVSVFIGLAIPKNITSFPCIDVSRLYLDFVHGTRFCCPSKTNIAVCISFSSRDGTNWEFSDFFVDVCVCGANIINKENQQIKFSIEFVKRAYRLCSVMLASENRQKPLDTIWFFSFSLSLSLILYFYYRLFVCMYVCLLFACSLIGGLAGFTCYSSQPPPHAAQVAFVKIKRKIDNILENGR